MLRHKFVALSIVIFVTFLTGCQPLWPLLGDSEKFISADVSGIGGGAQYRTLESNDAAGDAPSTAPLGPSEVEREIEEADVVKLIDHQLFVLSYARGLRIIDVTDWAKPVMRGSTSLCGSPIEMYVNNNVATIIALNNSTCYLDAQGLPATRSGSVVYTVDVSNADSPKVVGAFEIDGYVSASRRVGDVVYLAGVKTWSYYAPGSPDYTPEGFVASVLVADPTKVQLVEQRTFAGLGSIISATPNAIFVTGMNWQNGVSTIQYVDITDPAGKITLRGTCQVPGQILNRFALDAHEGVLRVVVNRERWFEEWQPVPDTTGAEGNQSSGSQAAKEAPKYGVRLYTFDIANPDSIASLGEVFLIANEALEAVRFDGPKAYVVTFERRDPLWVVDLADPANPAVTGYLEAPGYSTYLQPDGNRLVAVGIDDQQGWQACVMLYDVSDPKNPSELDRQVLGEGYSYSTATYDDKAFKVIPEAKLILVPFDSWEETKYANRLQMVDYTQDKLVKLAAVDHRGTVVRSGVDLESNVLWVLSQQVLQTLNIADRTAPQSMASLPLSDNVLAWRVVGGYGLRLITGNEDWQNPSVELQVLAKENPNGHETLSQKAFAMALYNTRLAVIDDSLAVLLGLTVDGKAKIVTIDLTALPEVKVLAEKEFDFYLDNYYYGYGGYVYKSMGYQDVMNLMAASDRIRCMPLWQSNQDNPMILSNRGLVFISVPQAYSYGSTTKQLKVVSLTDPVDLKVVSEVDVSEGDFDMVLQIGAAGATVFNTVGKLTTDSLLQILMGSDPKLSVMFSVRLIDCSDLANPQVQNPVNVPGVTIGLKDDYLFTMDPQWSGDEIMVRFCSVRIENGAAKLISSVDLPTGEPGPVRFTSGAAITTIQKFSWYGPYPMMEDVAVSSMAKEDECSLGSTRLITVNVSNPASLQLASDIEQAGLGNIAGVAEPYVIGQTWTSQGLLWRIGEDGSLSLGQVFDLDYAMDVSSADGVIYIATGPSGVTVVRP